MNADRILQRGRNGWLGALLTLVLFVSPLPAYAQALDPNWVRFRHFGVEDGLSQRTVLALAQDADGFIWFGTQDGLNRYDGHESRVYRKQPGQAGSISGNRITALAVDRTGLLWVGTTEGLNRYDADHDRFESFRHRDGDAGSLPDDNVNALLVDAEGSLWIGSNGGLARLAQGQVGFEPLAFASEGLTPPRQRINAFSLSERGDLWVGTQGGLGRWNREARRLEFPQPADPALNLEMAQPITALLMQREGPLWIGGDGHGLRRYHPATGQLEVQHPAPGDPQSLSSDGVFGLYEDSSRRIWVCTDQGLDLWLPGTPNTRFVHFRHRRGQQTSLGSGRAVTVLEDRAGALWFGTWTDGASVTHASANHFASFTPDSPGFDLLRDSAVHRITAGGDGRLLISARSGAYRLDPASLQLEDIPQLSSYFMMNAVQRPRAIWFGTTVGARILHDDGRLETPRPADIGQQMTYSLRFDGPRLWVGTRYTGIYVLDASSLQLIKHHPAVGWSSFIEPYDEQRMLVGAEDGLYWFGRDGQAMLHREREADRPDALRSSNVSVFLRSGDGTVWLGTFGGGLLRMRLDQPDDPASTHFTAYGQAQGLANEALADLFEDRSGYLWLATNRGISRFDPKRERFRNFSDADGAFASGYLTDSGIQLDSGRIALGGPDGITLFDPDSIGAAPVPPAPLLTELLLGNRATAPQPERRDAPLQRALHRSTQLTLAAANARSLGFRFATPGAVAPQSLRYAYRLDGFDGDWIETPASQRLAQYTNLPAGDYRFRVRAANEEGAWGAESTPLAIRIEPPWWDSVLARTLWIALLVLAVYAAHRLRLLRVETQQRRLQALVEQRTAQFAEQRDRAGAALDALQSTQAELVEAEKMASLGQLVAGIAHEINTPIGVAYTASTYLDDSTRSFCNTLAGGQLRRSDLDAFSATANESARLINHNLERAVELIRNFKQVSVDRTSEGRRRFQLGEYLRALGESLAPSWKRRPINVSFRCEQAIEMDSFPGPLGQVVSNLLQNALLHGFAADQSGHIEVIARPLDAAYVELLVQDDGQGTDAETLRRMFDPFFTTRRSSGGTGLGLSIVHNLVTAKLGGRVKASSTPGQGMQISVALPRVAPRHAEGGADP